MGFPIVVIWHFYIVSLDAILSAPTMINTRRIWQTLHRHWRANQSVQHPKTIVDACRCVKCKVCWCYTYFLANIWHSIRNNGHHSRWQYLSWVVWGGCVPPSPPEREINHHDTSTSQQAYMGHQHNKLRGFYCWWFHMKTHFDMICFLISVIGCNMM